MPPRSSLPQPIAGFLSSEQRSVKKRCKLNHGYDGFFEIGNARLEYDNIACGNVSSMYHYN
jgi:hypothetical protein